jgi:hypothetical protein
MLRGDPWLSGIGAGSCKFPDKCIVDLGWGAQDPVIQPCSGSCSFVLERESMGAYAHVHSSGTWTKTIFSRYIQTDDAPCNNGGGGGNLEEVCVRSVVTYSVGGINKTIMLTANLTKWI